MFVLNFCFVLFVFDCDCVSWIFLVLWLVFFVGLFAQSAPVFLPFPPHCDWKYREMEIPGGEKEEEVVQMVFDSEEEDEDTISFAAPTRQPHPNPVFVMKQYWKSLVGCTLVVLVLVLVATLTPLFVKRSEGRETEMHRADSELAKAAEGLKNTVRLAFIPASSLGLWVTGVPAFLEQTGGNPPEIQKSPDDDLNAPFQEAAKLALELVSDQIALGTVRNVALAPHGIVSAIFPTLDFFYVFPVGGNLVQNRRKGVLHGIFSNEFYLYGPVEPSNIDQRVLIARFPIFLKSENCSCEASSPTANHVAIRECTDKMQLAGAVMKNQSLESFYSFEKLSDRPEKFGVDDGRRFPTEVCI